MSRHGGCRNKSGMTKGLTEAGPQASPQRRLGPLACGGVLAAGDPSFRWDDVLGLGPRHEKARDSADESRAFFRSVAATDQPS